ncbi:MAG: SRPBCC family protein [Dysgonamonadaceae bacterium]|jgi:hypothetical protein|nr:SRPBCC family protein [Dysgonamonadaceae bacterium]
MTEFTSDVKMIPHSDADVYRVLSDLNKLELAKNQLPEDKIKDFTFDTDSISFRVDLIGNVKFVVVERETNKLIKFKSEGMPFNVSLWIQLVAKEENETALRLTVRAELNPFIKGVVEKPMKEAVEKISSTLAALPYDELI